MLKILVPLLLVCTLSLGCSTTLMRLIEYFPDGDSEFKAVVRGKTVTLKIEKRTYLHDLNGDLNGYQEKKESGARGVEGKQDH